MMKTLFKLKLLGLLLLASLSFTKCEDELVNNTEAKILSFTIAEIAGVINDNNYTITFNQSNLPPELDLTKISPTIGLYVGSTVQPRSGEIQDFSDEKEVLYTVTSADKLATNDYTVKITEKPNDDASLIAITILGDPTATVDIATTPNAEGIYEITIGVKEGTDLKNIKMDLTLAKGASTDKGLENFTADFTTPVDLVVTSEDGTTTKTYRITVGEQPNLLSLSVALTDDIGISIDTINRIIYMAIGIDADITSVDFNAIQLSAGATPTPFNIITDNQDLTNDFPLTITGTNGISVTYTISAKEVEELDGTPKQLISQTNLVRGGITFLANKNTIVIAGTGSDTHLPKIYDISNMQSPALSQKTLGLDDPLIWNKHGATHPFSSVTTDDANNIITNDFGDGTDVGDNKQGILYWTSANNYDESDPTSITIESKAKRYAHITVTGNITATATIYSTSSKDYIRKVELSNGVVTSSQEIAGTFGTGSTTKKIGNYLLISTNDDPIEVYDANDFSKGQLASTTLWKNEGGANIFELNGTRYMSVVDGAVLSLSTTGNTGLVIYDLSATGYTDLVDQIKNVTIASRAYSHDTGISYKSAEKTGNTEIFIDGTTARVLFSAGGLGVWGVDVSKK